MTHLGKALTSIGIRPVVNYQHRFETTYLYGCYSPIDGNSFVWEINGVSCEIFEKYIHAFSKFKPHEYKIVIIDNAGFHSTKNISIPDNIHLIRIPPYSPELNPSEQVWQFIKNRYKNILFDNMSNLKKWLHKTVRNMNNKTIMSITSNHHYLNAFNDVFYG